MCVYEQIRPYNGTVNTLHWLYLACVWYVLDTCWKREVLVVSSIENTNWAYVMESTASNILGAWTKLAAFFNVHSHFASMRASFRTLCGKMLERVSNNCIKRYRKGEEIS